VKWNEDADSAGVSLVVCGAVRRSMEFNKLKGLNTMIGEIVGDARTKLPSSHTARSHTCSTTFPAVRKPFPWPYPA